MADVVYNRIQINQKRRGKMKKIVSHLQPRHLDDFVAICILKSKYPEAEVEFVHPQKVPEEYLQDRNIAVVDVGGRYEPENGNYDHHQDRNIECSLVLVAKEHIENYTDAEFIRAIDITDRFGFQEAVKQGLVVPDREVDEKRKTVLLTEIDKSVADTVSSVFISAMQRNLSLNEFVENLYGSLENNPKFEIAKEKVEQENRAFYEKKENLETYRTEDGLLVGVSDSSFAPLHGRLFEETGINILIERNSMNDSQTSIIVNTASKNKDKAFAFVKMVEEEKGLAGDITFKHNTGFITVYNREINDVLDRIDDLLLKKAEKHSIKP